MKKFLIIMTHRIIFYSTVAETGFDINKMKMYQYNFQKCCKRHKEMVQKSWRKGVHL